MYLLDDGCFSYITNLKKKTRSVFVCFLDKKTDPIFTKKLDQWFFLQFSERVSDKHPKVDLRFIENSFEKIVESFLKTTII